MNDTMKNTKRTFLSVILLAALGMGFASLVAVVPTATAGPPDWIGDIGIDYQPNHYPPNPSGDVFNGHDVFYVGMVANTPVTNVYAELAQLKAAGFTIVRSYQTEPYSWIDLIRQANALGLDVIYEAAIGQNGNQNSITAATHNLVDVIKAVSVPTFQNTVVLVFAGHENYSNTNIIYLTSAIRQIIRTLRRQGLSALPVGTALVSGDLVTPGNPDDMRSLIGASSGSAPLGFDPYPFQWGVTPANQAASNADLMNSIAWDYEQVKQQSFYRRGKPILMAETGWATQGTGKDANYFCWINRQTNPCMPSVPNAAAYLQDLYRFVRTTSNTASALVFEAYDEPAKSPTHPDNAENYYGVFDTNCSLKEGNTNLLPNTSFAPGTNLGCQGFIEGTTFQAVGTQKGTKTNQPPFRVKIQQTNPTTSKDASMNVTVPTMDRSIPHLRPWPYFLLFDGADIKIMGVTSGASCTVTAQVADETITWGSPSCTDPVKYPITCTGHVCFLPWNNF